MGRVLAVAIFLNGLGAQGATGSGTVGISVVVRPEVALTMQGVSAVGVKIRLARASQTRLWKADVCAAPPAGGYVIAKSGSYAVPLTAIEGQGNRVCLAASDGSLTATVPLPPSAP